MQDESPPAMWTPFWTWWAVALAVVLVVFLVAEGWALVREEPGDTLSETVWALRERGSWLYYFILDIIVVTGVTMAWLLYHFRFQSGRVR